MPTITLSKKALLAACTKERSEEELKERISFLGTDLESIEKDDINVEIFPNRPDLLSQQGFNRAFTSFVGEKPGFKTYKVKKDVPNNRVIIDKSVADVRPYTACAIIKNMQFDDQKIKDVIQIQEKLHITYGRNRKRCAIGIYPLEHIKLPITYTAKKPEDIMFQPLEFPKEINGLQILAQHPAGRDYGKLLEGKEKFPIFVDANNQILSMPPIINSEKTGRISENTKDVFIECSGFSWPVVHGAIAIISTAFADIGGKLEELRLEYPKSLGGLRESPQLEPWEIPCKIDYITKYLGYVLDGKTIEKLLGKMGIGYKEGKHKQEFVALIPTYRVDILHAIDLVEDIAIAYGMENIDATIPQVATIAAENEQEKLARSIREVLIGHQLLEIKNYNITKKETQTNLINNTNKVVQVAHAASQEYDTLRSKLVGSGLVTLQKNKHHEYPQNVFEIGNTFNFDEKTETGIKEEMCLSVQLCGEEANYTTIRQILDSLLAAFDLETTISVQQEPHYIEGRSGHIKIKNKTIGSIGEITPTILENFSLEMPVSHFEISIVKLLEVIEKEIKI